MNEAIGVIVSHISYYVTCRLFPEQTGNSFQCEYRHAIGGLRQAATIHVHFFANR